LVSPHALEPTETGINFDAIGGDLKPGPHFPFVGPMEVCSVEFAAI